MIWKESFIKLSPEKEWTKLNTRQFNSIIDPVRIAYMKALSIPLQVRDIYRHGQGHTYGKLFNLIPVLNSVGKEVSQSSLITLFTEILFIPSYSLQNYIKKEKNGLQIPNKVRIIWHLDKGDYEYFKG